MVNNIKKALKQRMKRIFRFHSFKVTSYSPTFEAIDCKNRIEGTVRLIHSCCVKCGKEKMSTQRVHNKVRPYKEEQTGLTGETVIRP